MSIAAGRNRRFRLSLSRLVQLRFTEPSSFTLAMRGFTPSALPCMVFSGDVERISQLLSGEM